MTEPAPQQVTCGRCNGSGWVVRDPDIGTDQECFVCDGSGVVEDDTACAAPSSEEVQRMIGWLRVELGHLVTCKQAADMIERLAARVPDDRIAPP